MPLPSGRVKRDGQRTNRVDPYRQRFTMLEVVSLENHSWSFSFQTGRMGIKLTGIHLPRPPFVWSIS